MLSAPQRGRRVDRGMAADRGEPPPVWSVHWSRRHLAKPRVPSFVGAPRRPLHGRSIMRKALCIAGILLTAQGCGASAESEERVDESHDALGTPQTAMFPVVLG